MSSALLTFIAGTPESGGWTTREVKRIIRNLVGLNIVGADIVEVSPAYDTNAELTAMAAADLAQEFLALMVSSTPPTPAAKGGVLNKKLRAAAEAGRKTPLGVPAPGDAGYPRPPSVHALVDAAQGANPGMNYAGVLDVAKKWLGDAKEGMEALEAELGQLSAVAGHDEL